MDHDKKQEKSIILVCLQIFMGIGALFGGGALILDPSGDLIDMPVSMIKGSIFSNFLIPGILLFFVFGVIPCFVASGLTRQWKCITAEKLNMFSNKHWSWTFSLYIGFAIIIWITIQIYIINGFSIVHFIYIALGLIIQAVTLLPRVQRKYER
ncbi:hypothetical protein MNQ98_18540 [Paenibacillus sp. N3/727]|uniref:hypothetical protein n=1 Tax=Paenibacillus sp. N3/727 TaxID=2925845 RepID=UPI001F53007D|nr:hypothetical protein [Paenibacillus sp. N3/727]UNK16493.1 hypothetical protein MNQ98_18540 [Paenibacillus sp. N3/727]